MQTSRLTALIALVAIAVSAASSSSAQAPLRISRLAQPIRFDGIPNEPAWQTATPLPLTGHRPTFGQEPTERSDIRFAYDDTYLYAGGFFFTRDPRSIRTASLTRDQVGAEDAFTLLLDTFDDNENAVAFVTTPAGVRLDYGVTGDGASRNPDWNTFWDVQVARDAAGWSAEIRIPLSSLRYQVRNGEVVMGLIVSRFIAATNELATFPALDPSFANAPDRSSVARDVVFSGIGSRSPVYVTPYLLSGATDAARPPTIGSGRTQDLKSEVGLDVKYGVTGSVTLDLTANTDFAQVEADDEQVNLTRFSLFFPEKRQFFQERSGIFSLGLGGFNDPSLFFHSRRIGLTDGGMPLRIYGGARLVGRSGGWDFGLLDMHTDTGLDGESENLGVFRARRRVFNNQSTLGMMATTRLRTDGQSNISYAIDGRVRLFDNDYLTTQWAHTVDSEGSNDPGDAGMVRVSVDRPGSLTSKGFAYNVGVKWAGARFDPSLGFTPRRDYRNGFVNLRYGIFPGGSFIRSIQPSVAISGFDRNSDHRLQSAFLGGFVNYTTKAGALGWIGVTRNTEDLQQDLRFSADAFVPTGRYTFDAIQAAYSAPGGDRFQFNLNAQVGDFYDGTQWSTTIAPFWTVSEHLDLGINYTIQRFRFGTRGQEFNADLVRVRAQGALNAHLSGTVFVQYNQAARNVAANVRLRYHVSEGQDLWLVYNDRLNTDRGRAAPSLPLSQERALMAKYTYTFRR